MCYADIIVSCTLYASTAYYGLSTIGKCLYDVQNIFRYIPGSLIVVSVLHIKLNTLLQNLCIED